MDILKIASLGLTLGGAACGVVGSVIEEKRNKQYLDEQFNEWKSEKEKKEES